MKKKFFILFFYSFFLMGSNSQDKTETQESYLNNISSSMFVSYRNIGFSVNDSKTFWLKGVSLRLQYKKDILPLFSLKKSNVFVSSNFFVSKFFRRTISRNDLSYSLLGLSLALGCNYYFNASNSLNLSFSYQYEEIYANSLGASFFVNSQIFNRYHLQNGLEYRKFQTVVPSFKAYEVSYFVGVLI